jgi:hypothetical protein
MTSCFCDSAPYKRELSCAEPESVHELGARRQRLANLFYAMDSDLNGMLDVEEFREAMKRAEHELSGAVVSKVLESMDIHGRLTLDQFLAIVEVRSWRHASTGLPSFTCGCIRAMHATGHA